MLYEEPTLRRRFGAEYEDYCRRVPRWWPRLGGLLLLACVLSGPLACATTRIETQWKDPAVTAQDLAFRKVIALAQVDDETTRRAAEDELVRVLAAGPKAQARGMEVQPAYASISSAELGDVAALRAKVEAAGFDGAVVLRLVSDQERITYVPGRYEGMWGVAVSYDPGYTTVDRIVRVETSLYSIAQGRRLWSGVSRTLNPRDLRRSRGRGGARRRQALELVGAGPRALRRLSAGRRIITTAIFTAPPALVAPGVARGALHDAVARAERHRAAVELERDLAVEDHHVVERVGAVEAARLDLGHVLAREVRGDHLVGRQVEDAPRAAAGRGLEARGRPARARARSRAGRRRRSARARRSPPRSRARRRSPRSERPLASVPVTMRRIAIATTLASRA